MIYLGQEFWVHLFKLIVDTSVVSMLQLHLLLYLLPLQPVLCQDLSAQAQQLLSLLSPTPALGEPWPSIPGPAEQDRVCIVGAGAAGVHMAASLKKRGFGNVGFLFQPLYII